MNKIFNLLSQ